MKIRTVVLACVLLACKDPVPRGVAIAGCTPALLPPDTTAITTCLVEQHGWSGDSAVQVARQVHDSIVIRLQQLRDDSVAAAGAEAALNAVNDAADQAKQGPAVVPENYTLAMIWVGSKRSKLYYRGHCATAKSIRGADREEFSNDKMAEQSGYKRSSIPADSTCYLAPGI